MKIVYVDFINTIQTYLLVQFSLVKLNFKAAGSKSYQMYMGLFYIAKPEYFLSQCFAFNFS